MLDGVFKRVHLDNSRAWMTRFDQSRAAEDRPKAMLCADRILTD